MSKPLTTDEHRARHAELHKAPDELFADFIRHHPQVQRPTQQHIQTLLEWSYQQSHSPMEPPP